MSVRLLPQILRARVGSVGVALLVAALSSGCVANDISLSITEFIPPDPTMALTGICSFTNMELVHQTQGTYDLTLAHYTGTGYTASFIVKNNLLLAVMAPVETQAYYIRSYDVELDVQGALGAAIPAGRRQFNTPTASIRLAPGDTAAESVEVLSPDLIEAMYAIPDRPLGSVDVSIRAVATRAEEQQVTAFANFPIDVCVGCLAGTSTLAQPKTLPACPLQVTTAAIGNPCNIAQDAPATCCLSGAAKVLTCGAAALPTKTM